MRLALLVTALAACSSDHAAAIDAAMTVDAPPSCSATFEGNFAATSTDAADCAALDAGTLAFSIVQAPLAVPLTIAIDLGSAAIPGDYSSETINDWTVAAYEKDQAGGGGACQYSAGGSATPTGSFTLELTAIDGTTAHGILTVIAYVLVFPGTSCGTDNNETVTVTF
jgi:hypothetical protein